MPTGARVTVHLGAIARVGLLPVLGVTLAVVATSARATTYNRFLTFADSTTGTRVGLAVSVDSIAGPTPLDLSCRVIISELTVPVDTIEVPGLQVDGARKCIGPECCTADCGDSGCSALGAGLFCFQMRTGDPVTTWCICGTIRPLGTVAVGQTRTYRIEPLLGASPELKTDDDVLTVTGQSTVGVPAEGPSASGIEFTAPTPNPTTGESTIAFRLPRESSVRIELLDLSGHRVKILLDSRQLAAGSHVVSWNNRSGQAKLAPGVYFVRFSDGAHSLAERMVLLR